MVLNYNTFQDISGMFSSGRQKVRSRLLLIKLIGLVFYKTRKRIYYFFINFMQIWGFLAEIMRK